MLLKTVELSLNYDNTWVKPKRLLGNNCNMCFDGFYELWDMPVNVDELFVEIHSTPGKNRVKVKKCQWLLPLPWSIVIAPVPEQLWYFPNDVTFMYDRLNRYLSKLAKGHKIVYISLHWYE